MVEERQFVGKRVTCPREHRMKLEVLAGTPNMIRTTQCPTCQTHFIVISGDIRGVVPMTEHSHD